MTLLGIAARKGAGFSHSTDVKSSPASRRALAHGAAPDDGALVQLGLAAALPVTPLVLTMIPTWVSVTRPLGVLL